MIKQTVFAMKPWTTPGPDGFPPVFYQTMWDKVGNDLVKMVQSFFHAKHILKQMNHNFISLIPKNSYPKNLVDFRPISLCNTSYKVISKLLDSRIKVILEKTITPYQTAFDTGGCITDNIVIAHEFVDYMKKIKAKKVWMSIKLDMSKPFDRVEWPLLLNTLKKLGFCNEFCTMIVQCMSTVFYVHPFEWISRALLSAENDNLIHGIKLNERCPAVSHIFFADDCLIFDKANAKEARNLSFSPLLERYGDRLAAWKPKFLKLSGKTILTQSVLGSLDSHHMSVFPIPKTLTDKMDAIQMRFRRNKQKGKRGGYFKKWKTIAQPRFLGDGKYFHNFDPLNDSLTANGSWIWNDICRGLEIVKKYACWKILNALFDANTIIKIQDIRIPFDWQDCLRWQPNSSGSFTVKSAYKAILNDMNQKTGFVYTVPISWNSIWKTNLPGNILFFLWKCLHNCLLVGENLVSVRNVVINNVTSDMGNVQFNDWSCSTFQVNNKGRYIVSIVEWIRNANSVSVTNNHAPINLHWETPIQPFTKLNFNASYEEATHIMGSALILKEIAATTDGIRCSKNRALDPEQAEAKALLDAVLWAKDKGIAALHLQGDCQNVINTVNGNFEAIKWTTKNVVMDVLKILSSFSSWKCTFM
ncbi:uncharacterized protein LOC113351721 [Papaver somniferum]|uniref:uncharacterized protein LOC113351721 n=1 Tax=Papaver somniferum TaxID=3469 RepID=UPI000E6FB570|nr:uncharacterized protein LOC113351721 [Papaver somniferum]